MDKTIAFRIPNSGTTVEVFLMLLRVVIDNFKINSLSEMFILTLSVALRSTLSVQEI